MHRSLRCAAAIMLGLLAVVSWTAATAQPAPSALSPLAQVLQPYLLPASASPAGFQRDALQETTNVLAASERKDPDAIQALVQQQRIIGVRQFLHQPDGPLRFFVSLQLFRERAGSQADLRDILPPPSAAVSTQTLTRLPVPSVGDDSIGLKITASDPNDPNGAPVETVQIGFTVGRLEVNVFETGPVGRPQLADMTGPVQVLAAQATAQPLPPPSDTELQQLATQTLPASILHDAYRFLLANYFRPLEPAAVLAAAYSGAVTLLPPGAAAPTAPVITSADPEGAWAQFLPTYRQIEGLVGAAQTRQLAYAAAKVMYRPFRFHDCHTTFLTPLFWQRYLSGVEGGSRLSTGLSISFRLNDPLNAGLRIEKVAPGSPAEGAGLHPGDRIVAINGVSDVQAGDLTSFSLLGTDTIASSAGLHLTVYRPNVLKPLDFTIVPQPLTPPLERHQVLPGGIGYIDFRNFATGDAAVDAVREALGAFAADRSVMGIVLDLRLNPGGAGSTLLRIASLFLPADTPLLTLIDQQGRTQAIRTSGTPVVSDVPLVVLVGRGTASAAELFAETLRDAGRAQIVGEQSLGCVNGGPLFGLLDTAGAIISGATAYAGLQIVPLEGIGVMPDVAVDRSDEDLATGNDPQLQAALSLLQGAPPPTVAVAVAPVAPTGLQMDALSPTSIHVQWDSNASSNADGYLLYDAINKQPIPYAEIGKGTTEFTLVGLQPATEYCVMVYAFNSVGKSPPSEAKCKVTRSP